MTREKSRHEVPRRQRPSRDLRDGSLAIVYMGDADWPNLIRAFSDKICRLIFEASKTSSIFGPDGKPHFRGIKSPAPFRAGLAASFSRHQIQLRACSDTECRSSNWNLNCFARSITKALIATSTSTTTQDGVSEASCQHRKGPAQPRCTVWRQQLPERSCDAGFRGTEDRDNDAQEWPDGKQRPCQTAIECCLRVNWESGSMKLMET